MTGDLRAMTFNVRVDVDEDGADAWPRRRAFVADVVAEAAPDVVGLQEPLAHQYDYLRGRLPLEWAGVGRQDGRDGGEFAAVGHDPDRLERLDAETIWLSETPEVAGSVGWDGAHPRIATRASLRDRETGRRILFATLHLDHESETARREGARVALEWLASAPEHDVVVLTGDFNCPPGSVPYELVTGAEPAPDLRDAREVADERAGPAGTFHDFDGEPAERIDYVFVDGDDVRRYETVDVSRDGRYPSDHFPVVVELSG